MAVGQGEFAVVPGPSDLIRIVPLHVPEQLGLLPTGAAAPHLSYRGGPLLTAVEVFPVLWGAEWQQPPLNGTATQLETFFDYILTSALIDQLAEYNVPGQAIGRGKRVGSALVSAPAPKHSVTDSAVQHMLQHQIGTNAAFPRPSANRLYFVYLPPGVSVVHGGSRSCQAFCGYHSDVRGQLFYAVMPYPGCAGCVGGLAPLDALTSTSSHELCEAITDAVPGQGWYDDVHGQIGDICAWQTKRVGPYTVQLEWSNQQVRCI